MKFYFVALLLSVMLLCVLSPTAGAAVLGAAEQDEFAGWIDGFGRPERRDAAIGAIGAFAQPRFRQFTASGEDRGTDLRFDSGASVTLRGLVRRDLDFDLPGDSMGRSSTVSFGPALFKLDLPFLNFDVASATYSFKESWKPESLGDVVFGDGEISLADIDSWDAYAGSERNTYDVEGRRIDGTRAAIDRMDTPLMLSSTILLRDGEDVGSGQRVSAFGGVAMPEDENSLSSDAGLAGLLAVIALGGIALFITLEITRDKLD